MKPERGTIKITDRVYVAREVKEPKDLRYGFSHDEYYSYKSQLREYQKATEPIPVGNAELMDDEDPDPIIAVKGIEDGYVLLIISGQQVEFTVKDGEAILTKIL